MAIQLEQAVGSTTETWLKMQLEYDPWQAKQRAGNLQVTCFASRVAC
jgi:plasmid maintenance system antidote protein VapI